MHMGRRKSPTAVDAAKNWWSKVAQWARWNAQGWPTVGGCLAAWGDVLRSGDTRIRCETGHFSKFKDGSATDKDCLSSSPWSTPIIAALQLVSRPAGRLPRPFWHRDRSQADR